MSLNFQFSEEQKMLQDTARRFAKDRILPHVEECDRASKFPMPLYKEAFDLGLLVPEIPEAYGGPGLGVVENCLIIEEFDWACSGIGTSLAASSLCAAPIIIAGSEDQKKKWLGALAVDGRIGAYATTEPGAGSDVGGLECKATRHGDDWVLNGTKCFITNGSFADFVVVFATTDKAKRHKGIMAFIVPADAEGFRRGKKEDKLGQRASDTVVLHLDDVKLSKDHVLAGEGDGFKVAMMTFDRTRPWIGAGAVGVMRRCLDECRVYASERKTFGQPIGNHQMVQWMIAEMAIRIEASRLLTLKAAWQVDHGDPSSIVSSYSKAYSADAAMKTAVDAVQIFGGNGYMKDYPVEKLMRDAKIFQIYEGTSQIQRMVIARRTLAG